MFGVGPSQLLDLSMSGSMKGVVEELRSRFFDREKGLLRKIDAARESSFSTGPRLAYYSSKQQPVPAVQPLVNFLRLANAL